MTRRAIRLVSVVAAVVLVAGLAVAGRVLAEGGPAGPATGRSHHPAPTPSPSGLLGGTLGSARQLAGSNLSLVPPRGAYLGAYVQPGSYTQTGMISAVQQFQHVVGHRLELVHLYTQWGKPFPTQAGQYFAEHGRVVLLTWGGSPDTKAIAAGQDDAMIRASAEAVKALHRPVLIEFRHEMDRPNLQWTIHGPAAYIAAWDHIRAIFRSVGASNASWVWCPTGYGFQVGRAQAFYPGNKEVDWVCADVYSSSTAQSLSTAAAPFLAWAAATGKPVILGEFAAGGPASGWAAWLAAAARLAQTDRQIKAMAYFDANGTDSNGLPFSYWLGDHPAALSSFARMLGQSFFRPPVHQ
jgi:glycosyl hydrolase family 26